MMGRMRSYSPALLAAGLVLTASISLGVMLFGGTDPDGPREGMGRGGDLISFWDGGSILAEEDPGRLYDRRLATKHQRRVAPLGKKKGYRLGYPPPVYQAAERLVPLGYFRAARLTMILMALATAAGSIALATVRLGDRRPLGPWVMAGLIGASPAGIALVGTGQISGVWLALVGLGIALLVARRDVAAGVACGLLCAKPSIALPVLAALVLAGRWRACVGFGLGGASLLAISLLADGVEPWLAWIAVQEEPADFARRLWNFPHRQLTLRSAFGMPAPRRSETAMLLGWIGVGVGTAVMLGVAQVARRRPRDDQLLELLAVGALLSAGLLATPHLFDYDVVLHAPGWVASAWWIASGRAVRPRAGALLLVGAWLSPVFTGPALATHVAVGVVLILLWVLWMGSELAAARGRCSPS